MLLYVSFGTVLNNKAARNNRPGTRERLGAFQAMGGTIPGHGERVRLPLILDTCGLQRGHADT